MPHAKNDFHTNLLRAIFFGGAFSVFFFFKSILIDLYCYLTCNNMPIETLWLDLERLQKTYKKEH